VFRYPRNWTGVVFFGMLGFLHWGLAMSAVRGGAQLSIVFGAIFVGVALGLGVVRREVVVLAGRGRIFVEMVVGQGVIYRRSIAFSRVTCVRVLMLGPGRMESSVVVVCEGEDVELPFSRTPRQMGLLLAMTIGVRLVKIYGNGNGNGCETGERIARFYRSEDVI